MKQHIIYILIYFVLRGMVRRSYTHKVTASRLEKQYKVISGQGG